MLISGGTLEGPPNQLIDNYMNLPLSKKTVLSRAERYGDLSPLISGTPISYYWLGYLMADGWFDHKKKAIMAWASVKDLEHLELYAFYVKAKTRKENEQIKPITSLCFDSDYKEIYSVRVRHKEVVEKLIEQFKLVPKKTYNPPDLSSIFKKDDLFLSFLVGFIDGDGTISSQPKSHNLSIRIQIHKSWFSNLELIETQLYKTLNIKQIRKLTRIKNDTAFLNLARYEVVYRLYQRVLALNLPWLERKWLKIANYPTPVTYETWIENNNGKSKDTCSLCDKKHFGKGYCVNHYYHFVTKKNKKIVNSLLPPKE